MAKVFSTKPVKVKSIKTKYRKISGSIPSPKGKKILDTLRKYEPLSMTGQPAIVWEKALGSTVTDIAGNKYIDFSCGVLVASAGHGRKEIRDAIKEAVNTPLLTNYCFPNKHRAALVKTLAKVAPKGLDKVFLLTTGSEATEVCQKLARTQGLKINKKKNVFVTFTGSFHGRTLGSQLAGGIPALQEWVVNKDKDIVHVPHPSDFRQKDKSFKVFLKALKEQKVNPKYIAGVMFETYAGGTGGFLPLEYAKALKKFCNKNKALIISDEVQAGFGRTGKFWGFEHYGKGWTPDLIACGKGISSSLPLSCVIGRARLMDLYGPNEMTSTHTGNPVCSAAAKANIDIIIKEKLTARSARLGKVMFRELNKIQKRYPECIADIGGKGLIAAIQFVKKGTTTPNADLAFNITKKALEMGLMLFAPVGSGGGTIKFNPPLSIPEDALLEGCAVLSDAIDIVMKKL